MFDFVFTASTPPAGSGSVEIEVDKPSSILVAPVGIFVKAVNHAGLAAFEESGTVYDGAFHEYYHFWTVRRTPGGNLPDFTAPTNLPAAWKGAEDYQGLEACISLFEPGTYEIDLVVFDRLGDYATATTTAITVADPDTHFADADTVYVDKTGTFTGVPAGVPAANKVTSLAAAWTYLEANTRPHRVRLRRGDVYEEDRALRWGTTRQAVYTDAWGSTGDRPAVMGVTDLSSLYYGNGPFTRFLIPGVDQWTLKGIELRGDYDAATETGVHRSASGIVFGDNDNDTFLMVHDCRITGCGMGMYMADSAVRKRIIVSNTTITNWGEYGILVGSNEVKYGFPGTAVVQNVDALHGGSGFGSGSSDGFSNGHGPMRFGKAKYADLQKMDLFSRNGWSDSGVPGHRADQPCVRWHTSSVIGDPDNNLHISQCVMEGGYIAISLAAQNALSDDIPKNILIENTLILASPKNEDKIIDVQSGGTTLRNMMCWYSSKGINGGGRTFAASAPDNPTADNLTNPVTYHNMSIYNARGAAYSAGRVYTIAGIPTFTNTTIENNILYGPDLDIPITTEVPVTLQTITGVTPRFKGIRYGWSPVIVTIPEGGWPNGGTYNIPYADLGYTLSNGEVTEAGTTDQAYWLANAGTKHRMKTKGGLCYSEDTGGIRVDFNATEVVITNTSGGTVWGNAGPAGTACSIGLDRVSQIPAMDTTLDVTGETVQVVVSASESSAYRSGAGRVTPRDVFNKDRSKKNPSGGAVEPA
ncbi:hypothetical protein [Pseudophaeobacter sp.]|uniref:hypothetical protein n=1 Tax=Rhodobacterales TaxID=204455 RepID=UPI003299B0B3